MKKAMRKIIAVVLTVTMILGTTVTAFAGGLGPGPVPPLPDGNNFNTFTFGDASLRYPHEPVSLTILHLQGLLPANMQPSTPGQVNPWDDPTLVNAPNEPVIGSQWNAMRVQGPNAPAWTNAVHTPPPTAQANVSTIPASVREAMAANAAAGDPIFGPMVAGVGGAPDRWPILTTAGIAFTPAEGGPWYRTSDVLEATTNTDGLATFAAGFGANETGVTNHRVNCGDCAGCNAAGPCVDQLFGVNHDAGHGFWLVWEVYVPGGPTEENDLVQPFIVSLPMYRHITCSHVCDVTPGGTCDPDCVYVCACGVPGHWVYDVLVIPKQEGPPQFGKEVGPVDVGRFPYDSNSGADFPMAYENVEYSLIPWWFDMEVFRDIRYITQVPNVNMGIAACGTCANCIATPVLVCLSDYFIVMSDALDPRLVLSEGTPNNPRYATTLPANMDANYWLSVTLETACGASISVPRVGNWEVVTQTIAIGAALPNPHSGNAPANVGNRTTQVFQVRFTQAGRNFIADAAEVVILTDCGACVECLSSLACTEPIVGCVCTGTDTCLAPEGMTLRVHFVTIAQDLTTAEWGNLPNTGYLLYQTRPPINIPPNQRPRTQVHNLLIEKINPQNQPLNGAVFFLFTYDQVEGPAGNRTRITGEEPYRVAISGGVAGSTITTAMMDANNVLAADRPIIADTPAYNPNDPLPATTGHTWFSNLPPGIYYLYEAIAPGEYRRITGLQRIYIREAVETPMQGAQGACGTCADCLVPGADPWDCDDFEQAYIVHPRCDVCAGCIAEPQAACTASVADRTELLFSYDRADFQWEFTFTNTRDFRLPMTGGAGTIMFTAAGVSLMGIAGLFLFLSRKKDNVKNR